VKERSVTLCPEPGYPHKATGNRQRESKMKYFLDNPRARVLIGHQNSNPRILLMYQFYIIVRLGFIIAKRGQVIRVKKPWIKKLSSVTFSEFIRLCVNKIIGSSSINHSCFNSLMAHILLQHPQ